MTISTEFITDLIETQADFLKISASTINVAQFKSGQNGKGKASFLPLPISLSRNPKFPLPGTGNLNF